MDKLMNGSSLLLSSPEHNDTSWRKLSEHHFLCVAVTVTGEVAELRLGQLYVCPHVQHMTCKPIDDVCALLKLARIVPSDESGLQHNLLDNSRHCEGRDVGIVCVWA